MTSSLINFIQLIISDDYCKNEQPNQLLCPNNCGRVYTGYYGKSNLKKHLQFECGVEPKFSCSFCQKRFSRKSSLKSHVILVHKTFI